MKEISVVELKRLKEDSAPHVLIDVREDFEREVSHIGGKHIPLGAIGEAIEDLKSEIDPESDTIIVYCRGGNRSKSVVGFLEQNGFKNAVNLKGGISAWKNEIDQSLTVA